MTTLYFIRHAQPNFNNHDDRSRELTPKGLEDRKLVTDFLYGKNIDAVLSSPFQRAIETVRHFADKKGMTVTTIESFRERRIDSGWIDNFHEFSKKQWENFDYKLPGGESLRETQERNIAALRQTLSDYEGKNVAIGSHGTALSAIINYFDPSFGYEDFSRIKNLMPWVVEFIFEGQECISIRPINLFENK